MIYHNTPLMGSLQFVIQILQGRSARSDLSMSNAARNKLGIQPEVLWSIDKQDKLPTHDLHVGQPDQTRPQVTNNTTNCTTRPQATNGTIGGTTCPQTAFTRLQSTSSNS